MSEFRERILKLQYGYDTLNAGWHMLLMPGQTITHANSYQNKCYIIQVFENEVYCQKWQPSRKRYLQLPRAFAELAYLAVFPHVV